MGRKAKGQLVLIGGNEDLDDERIVINKVYQLFGGKESRIVILPTASATPEKSGALYKEVFEELGCSSVSVLNIQSRADAADRKVNQELKNATGVFITGGDQLRLTKIVGGSCLHHNLDQIYQSGAVIAGTSAGASVMSSTMIVRGREEDPPSLAAVSMAPGLELVEEIVIDQHFDQRGRIGRLLAAVGHNPHITGLGIDEDTAAVINHQGMMQIVGRYAVTIVDGKDLIFSNITEDNRDLSLAMSGITLHVLPQGYKYDLNNRTASEEDG